MPRGVDYRFTLAQLREAERMHRSGWSLRAIGRLRFREWGSSSPQSAAMALSSALHASGGYVRDRVEAVRAFSTVHGDMARAAADPASPDHSRFLARRRINRRKAGR